MTCVCASASRVETTWRFVSAPRLKKEKKKNREKTGNRTRRSTPAFHRPLVRTRQRVCTRQTGGRGRGNPISRMRAGLTRLSRVRLGDLSIPGRITWLPFNRPFDCFPAYSTCLVFRVHIYSLPYFSSFSFVSRYRILFYNLIV